MYGLYIYIIHNMKQNLIQDKTFQFSLTVIDTYKTLMKARHYVLGKQFLRSWTSIWANIQEALWSQSRKEFFAKMSIAYREATETEYWIRLLIYAKYLSLDESTKLLNDILEIIKIIWSIRKTLLHQIRNINS